MIVEAACESSESLLLVPVLDVHRLKQAYATLFPMGYLRKTFLAARIHHDWFRTQIAQLFPLLVGLKGTFHAKPALSVVENIRAFAIKVGCAAHFVSQGSVQVGNLTNVDSCGRLVVLALHSRHEWQTALFARPSIVGDVSEGQAVLHI